MSADKVLTSNRAVFIVMVVVISIYMYAHLPNLLQDDSNGKANVDLDRRETQPDSSDNTKYSKWPMEYLGGQVGTQN